MSQQFSSGPGMTPSLFECRAAEAHETLGGLCVTGALTVSEGETKRLKAGKHGERAQFRPQLLFKNKNKKQPALDWRITS